jgi:hypothetical protein
MEKIINDFFTPCGLKTLRALRLCAKKTGVKLRAPEQ